MPPPRILRMMSNAEPKLRGKLSHAEPHMQRQIIWAEPRLMRAEGGAVNLQSLYAALKAADAAGDTVGARAIAAMIAKAQNQQPQQQPITEQPNVPQDVGHSIAAGLTSGAANVVGMGGNLSEMGANLIPKPSPDQQAQYDQEISSWPPFIQEIYRKAIGMPPTGQDVLKAVPGASGIANYQPKTGAGEWAKAGTELVPGAIAAGGAGTIPQAIGAATKLGVIPGVVGKTFADMAPADWKPYAQFAGNLVGGVGASIGSNAVRSTFTNPTKEITVPPFKISTGPPTKAVSDAITRITTPVASVPPGTMGNRVQQMFDDIDTLRAAGYPVDTAPTLGEAIRSGPAANPAQLAAQLATETKANFINTLLQNARTSSAKSKNLSGDIKNAFISLDKRIRTAQTSNPTSQLATMFTPEEQAIITKIARGEPVQNLLSTVGNISPNFRTLLTEGGVIGAGEYLLHHDLTTAGLVGGAALTTAKGVGSVAKSAANMRQNQNIRALGSQITTGTTPPRIPTLNIPTIGGVYGPDAVGLPPDLEDRYP